MNRQIVLIILLSCLFFQGCIGRGKHPKPDPGAIYSDYRIWGDEESGNVSVKVQYFMGDHDGPTLLLEPPASVTIDGTSLIHDSTEYSGDYYELLASASEFGGKHEFVFTDAAGKMYKTPFDFPVITIKTIVPDTMSRRDLVLDMDGLKPGDLVRISMIDTSLLGNGLERMDTIKDDQIIIRRGEMDSLKSGPVNLIISREEERRLTETTSEGGKIYISYALKRDFFLLDSIQKPLK